MKGGELEKSRELFVLTPLPTAVIFKLRVQNTFLWQTCHVIPYHSQRTKIERTHCDKQFLIQLENRKKNGWNIERNKTYL